MSRDTNHLDSDPNSATLDSNADDSNPPESLSTLPSQHSHKRFIYTIAIIMCAIVFGLLVSQIIDLQDSSPATSTNKPIISANPEFETQSKTSQDLDTTLNLPVYTNQAYGYQITYTDAYSPQPMPPNDTYENAVNFVYADLDAVDHDVMIAVTKNSLQDQIALEKLRLGHNLIMLQHENDFVLQGLPAHRLEYSPIEGYENERNYRTVVIVSNGQMSYIISAHPSTIDMILSDFKLTSADIILPQANNSKTYKNITHGYQFNYPDNWQLYPTFCHGDIPDCIDGPQATAATTNEPNNYPANRLEVTAYMGPECAIDVDEEIKQSYWQNATITDDQIGGFPARLLTGEVDLPFADGTTAPTKSRHFNVIHIDTCYDIHTISQNDATDQIHDAILASFKFISQ